MMKRVTLLVCAALTVGAVIATTALASGPEWLCNGQAITGTGNSRCLVRSENLEPVVLEDMGLGRVECPSEAVLGEGWVGPGAEAEITLVSFVKPCTAPAKFENLSGVEEANACESTTAPTITTLHLPWKTKIVEKEGSNNWWILGESGVGGLKPGWELTCKVAGLNKKDKCENGAESPLALAENLLGSATELPLVTVVANKVLLAAAEACTCSAGGVENGLIFGEGLLEAVQGTTQISLEISEP
jgi:hypothetical protein